MSAGRPTPDGRVRVVPSLLAADSGRLAEAVGLVEAAGADWVSVDVMDGRFVPNLSFGPDLVRHLRPRTRACLEAHLMVSEPKRFAPVFAEAGADFVTVHLEACPKPRALLRGLRSLGAGAGIALKPATPASAVEPYLADADLVLVMTVEPGFGGQGFLRGMLPKIRALRDALDRRGLRAWLMADGGINRETAAHAAGAGADALVAGTSVFKAADPAEALKAIRRSAQEAYDGFRREVPSPVGRGKG